MNPQEQLSQMISKNSLPHALLFAGPKGEKEEIAYEFAGNVICHFAPDSSLHRRKIQSKNHPDIHQYHPEGKSGVHAIHTIRQLMHEVAMRPNESTYKIFLIYEAERMLPTSANALLKTLEEPSSQTLMILLSAQSKRILPTVLSRCQMIYFSKQSHPPTDPIAEQLLDILSKEVSVDRMDSIMTQLDDEKKGWEKTLYHNLPSDLTAVQKGDYEKEIEGTVTLHHHDRLFALLETILAWYRDVEVVHLNLPDSYLFFPSRKHQLKKCELMSLGEVEFYLAQVRLAIERSMKPAYCFEVLMLKLIHRINLSIS